MFKSSISSKMAIVALGVLAIFLADLKFKQWQNQKAIESNIQSLKAQESERQQKNNELSKSLDYLSSPDFKEKVAREQLGYKKNGEVVYGFSESQPNQGSDTGLPNGSSESNPVKWWNYFFAE